MGGEHFSSATGRDLDKQKDAYVRFRWETKRRMKRPKQTILEKEKILENKEIADWVGRQYPKHVKTCVCCQQPEAWPLLRVEFYNWEAPNTEHEVFAHQECLKKLAVGTVLEGLRLMGKNPTFLPVLNCLSADKCAVFSKSNDFRNCQHIVLRFDEVREDNKDGTISFHMSPILFCKRAHPGEASLEAEAETWWNVEDAGLVLMTQRLTEVLSTPQSRARIEIVKAQHPELVGLVKKGLEENSGLFGLVSPQALILAHMIVEPSAEETWNSVTEGNDYY